MSIANEMLDSVRDEPNLLQRVINGDEAWVYGYDVETKAQSSQWKLPHEPRPKKARQVRSNVKVLLTVFFDCRGVVHHEFLPQGRTVNKEYYLQDRRSIFEFLKPGETVNTSRYEQQMHSLREAVNEKRPEWREKHNKLILQHDNAPAQNATVVKNTIKDLSWELLPHPLYSPDLAPSDYHLFTSLGHARKKQEFSNSDILRKWLVDWFDSKGIEFFRQGIRKLPERWSECIANQGNYSE
ncbi:hypothetical protein LAZ67_2005472 [Cordylochernes scorpioides]|uniref:Mariner Mos1 transposase n=1 Tax=Cordylochernes scorpioides TaxID=51811 RepID=A0ABY6K4F6_9ARAC|nr:hypothetical protein LAZ67_2005472 [Cordylochernes scorpioides]